MDHQRIQLTIISLCAFITGLCWCLPSEFSILTQNGDDHVSEELVFELFNQWREKHDKDYKQEEEIKRRFENFQSNLRFVMETNFKKGSSASMSRHVVGLNKFADMSNEEFREVYLSKVKSRPVKNNTKMAELKLMKQAKLSTCEVPSTLDWRKRGVVTGVKDQGQCGSCWAFSATGAMEGINAIVAGYLISLSEQELVDCDSTDEGCNGGYMDTAFKWVISNGGINTESGYPYTGLDGTCNINEEQTKVVTIDGYEDIYPEESALLCAVVNQPISVGIQGSSRDFQLYTEGIYNGDCSSNPDDIDHAILVVGYGSEGGEQYWIAKNSWGTSWGMNGYMNTSLEYGVCAINAMASYPTKEPVSPSAPLTPTPPLPPSPPPSPSPNQCADFSYCPPGTTCCCVFEFYGYCLTYGCCDYENGVCCTGTRYCCPQDYPICDADEGLCYKFNGDPFGITAKKREVEKHKFPWTKLRKPIQITSMEEKSN